MRVIARYVDNNIPRYREREGAGLGALHNDCYMCWFLGVVVSTSVYQGDYDSEK